MPLWAGTVTEGQLRESLQAPSGLVLLPAGVVELSTPIELPPGARRLTVRGAAAGTTLRLTPQFKGPAALSCASCEDVRFENFTIEGSRDALPEPREVIPPDTLFASYYAQSGIHLDHVRAVRVVGVRFRKLAGLAVLATGGANVTVEDCQVEDSGSRNAKQRNNGTGGILFEEGTLGFAVRRCQFRRIRGNAVWTHSWHHSRRAQDGIIASNDFTEIGRDAIQVGHATNVMVENNTGARIGYPIAEVDVEGQGIPVAVDTAGNVDHTSYRANRFAEINGKCFDLDGFHDGEVANNTCTNSGPAEEYPFGHFGIVFNNTNPDMTSSNVVVRDNVISGTRFGGIFVIGTGHQILRNRLTRLNLAHCNENQKVGCVYNAAEPDMLQTGIYLGTGAERPGPAQNVTVKFNQISGYRMKDRCLKLAPRLDATQDEIAANRCMDE